jgi:two-component system nitrogen regulation response regulator NtrX
MPAAQILLIDDEPNIRATLAAVLGDAGYSVTTCASAEEALGLPEVESRFGLAVVDLALPGMDGLAAFKELRGRGFAGELVMISGHATLESAMKAAREGAFDFLEKPLSAQKTLLTVRNALAARQLRRQKAALESAQGVVQLVGDSPAIAEVRQLIASAGPTDSRLLITGENGTGKDLVAQLVHRASPRADGPFIALNCAALPEELIESELFGHAKGAFTGAEQRRRGKFQLADGGTLFLDEIGDMSARTQAKVLRALETGRVTPVGDEREIPVDVRLIAATHQDLPAMIEAGRFRNDLYYRLNVVQIPIPPLRERRADLAPLRDHFLAALAPGRRIVFAPEAWAALERYGFPGNVRELRNILERLVILAHDGTITAAQLPREVAAGALRNSAPRMVAVPPEGGTLRDARELFERNFILAALRRAEGSMTRAAETLGLERSYLYKKMKALKIEPPKE